MTLILTTATAPAIIQVGDRLVTDRGKPIDAVANKTIVCQARDAIATIGYSGIAEVRARPTDVWLVEALIGKDLDRDPDGELPNVLGRVSDGWPDLGQVVQRIEAAIASDVCTARRARDALEVIIAGWQHMRRKPYWRPTWIHIDKPANKKVVEVTKSDRYWQYNLVSIAPDRRAYPIGGFVCPAANMEPNSLQEIGPGIWETVITSQSIAELGTRLEEILAEAIRAISRSGTPTAKYIGEHCMAVRLPRPGVLPQLNLEFPPSGSYRVPNPRQGQHG